MRWQRPIRATSLAVMAVCACNLMQIGLTPSPTSTARPDSSLQSPPSRTAPYINPTATPTSTIPAPSGDSPCPTAVESVDAIMTSCPTACELAWFKSDFDIVFEEIAGLPPYACQNGLDPGGGVNPRLVVYQALRAMDALSFDQPLPWTDQDLYAWLREAIDGIKLTTTSVSHCCDPDNRIVLKSDLLGQASHATWYDPQSGIGLSNLVGLIVHEARHAEIGGHTCGHDDQTLEELGSWGVQYYYFTWLAEHSAGWLTEQQKTGASYSADVALERICNP